jgi:hypothetical protein
MCICKWGVFVCWMCVCVLNTVCVSVVCVTVVCLCVCLSLRGGECVCLWSVCVCGVCVWDCGTWVCVFAVWKLKWRGNPTPDRLSLGVLAKRTCVNDSQVGDYIEWCKLVEYSFGVSDGVRSFQDTRVCISVRLVPNLVMLPGRDVSLSEDDTDHGDFFLFWNLFRVFSRRDSHYWYVYVCLCLIDVTHVLVLVVTSGPPVLLIEVLSHDRIQIVTIRPIRVDHTQFLQVDIKTHSFTVPTLNLIYLS